jgi:hypothetical protein
MRCGRTRRWRGRGPPAPRALAGARGTDRAGPHRVPAGEQSGAGHRSPLAALVRAFCLGGGYAETWAEVERAWSLGQSAPADLLRDLAARMPEPGK